MSEPTLPEKLYIKVDSQILSSMDLCPERYNLEMVEHWRPLAKAKALERGSVLHTMVAAYRRHKRDNIIDFNTKHGAIVRDCLLKGRVAASATENISVEIFEEEDVPVFQEYVLRWQYDAWEIHDVEQPFSKILYEDDIPIVLMGALYSGIVIIYEGVVDARVRDIKIGMAVVDTKTESRRSWPYILSNQFQGYEWAFGVPVIVDKVGYQTSLKPEEKFRRLVHDSGDFAIQEWKEDAVGLIKQAVGWHNILAEGGRLKKNRTSCDKYSGCIFQKVCKVPVEVRPFKLQAYFYKDKAWDPYTRDEHEVEADD